MSTVRPLYLAYNDTTDKYEIREIVDGDTILESLTTVSSLDLYIVKLNNLNGEVYTTDPYSTTDNVTIVTPVQLGNRVATATLTGITRYATGTETTDGTEPNAAVTPLSLSQRTATTTRTGLVELATNAESSTSDATRAVTPAGLMSVLASYVTTTALTTTLSNYVTGASLTSTLSNYVTSASLTSTLGSYVTNSSLTTTLANYTTSSDVNTRLNQQRGMNGHIILGGPGGGGGGTFTVPANVYKLKVYAYGAGGGSGIYNDGQPDAEGEGGGGGGCAIGWFAVTPGQGIAYTTGVAGVSSPTGSGTDGGDTTILGMTAGGGKAGLASGTSGEGGIATGGQVNLQGGRGQDGNAQFQQYTAIGGDCAGPHGGQGSRNPNLQARWPGGGGFGAVDPSTGNTYIGEPATGAIIIEY